MPRFALFEVTKDSLCPVPACYAASVEADAGCVSVAAVSAGLRPPPPRAPAPAPPPPPPPPARRRGGGAPPNRLKRRRR
ncbi:MAG: hypothetical protein LBL45_00195 [Treponema sp.]|nr:hypothetical protein [Treponema sp.]